MEFTDLRVFARVADLRSISATARQLAMPKSTVSRSLVRLEAAMGTTLVERSTRYLRLTDAGSTLQRHARRILDDVAEAENAVMELSGEAQGDLRVTAPFTLAVGPIAEMMPEFVRRHPKVRVALTIDNRVLDIAEEEQDVAVRVGPLSRSPLIQRRLGQVEMWLCASPDYLGRTPAVDTPADLAGHLLISYGAGRGSDPWTFTSPADPETRFAARISVREPLAILSMTQGGTGIGLLPDFIAAHHVHGKRLVRLLPRAQLGMLPIHALYPSHRGLSSKVRVFIDALAGFMKPKYADE